MMGQNPNVCDKKDGPEGPKVTQSNPFGIFRKGSLGKSFGNYLVSPKILHILSLPDEFGLTVIDEYLCASGTGVVGACHGESVCTSNDIYDVLSLI